MLRALSIAAALTVALAAGVSTLPMAHAEPAAGTVESVEPLSAAATLPGSVNGERFFYTTTAVGDAPTVASAAVYFPPGAPPEGGWPVIGWAHGTVGLADDCAYSVNGPGEVERDWAYLGTWIHQGYAIVAADYAGLGTPGELAYMNGEVAAHNVVDAVKAAGGHYGSLSSKWVVVGQSEGGAAAVTTARYATEFGGAGLDYRGGVATSVPAYLEDPAVVVGPGVPPVKAPTLTAEILYLIDGLNMTYPELNLGSYLTDAGRDWMGRAAQLCEHALIDELTAHNVVLGDLFARPLAQVAGLHSLLHRYLDQPETGYDKPLFLGQGLHDTDIPMPESLRFAAALQANGQPVTVRTYPTTHGGTVNASLVDTVPFVRNLFS